MKTRPFVNGEVGKIKICGQRTDVKGYFRCLEFGHIAAKCAVDCDRSKRCKKCRERSYTQGVQRLTLNICFAKDKTVSAAAATDGQYLGKP